MLTRLRIQNFKAWQDTGDIRLAPLTVFFGTNSSGKTSILQFLLMLKQTVQSLDRKRVLNFGDSRSIVDLGVWPEMVFRHDPSRAIEFSLEYSTQRGWSEGPDGKVKTYESTVFEATVGASIPDNARAELQSFTYRQLRPKDKGRSAGLRRTGINQYQEWVANPGLEREYFSQEISAVPIHFNGFPMGKGSRRFTQGFVMQIDLNEQLESLCYLAPLRITPSRLYISAGEIPEDVGLDGELIVEALLAARARQFFVPSKPHLLGLEAFVARWLQQMGLVESFEIRGIAPHRKEYEVFVRTAGMKDAVNLTDVGFGVSQVLPVLVQLLYVERESTLIFEQPELHLHPRAQSALADIFIESLQVQEDREDDVEPRNIQLLVETHSEHFLRRIQRRIAEQVLDPRQVALYFCKPSPEGSTIEELKLDEFGNITNWPENFFGDEVGDLVAMTEAAMKRQMAPGQS